MNRDSTTAAALGAIHDAECLDAGPGTRTQWGAIAAGSLAGFGATIIMTTLGLAIGATTGAVAAEESGAPPSLGEVATGAGVALAVWTLLSALVVGFVGGAVLNRMARYDRPYMPTAFGALTWAGGIVIALLVGASQGPALMAGAAAGYERKAEPADRAIPRAEERGRDPREAAASPMEEGRRQDVARKAATGAAAAAWVLLGAQLVSLAATVLAARWREIPVRAGASIG